MDVAALGEMGGKGRLDGGKCALRRPSLGTPQAVSVSPANRLEARVARLLITCQFNYIKQQNESIATGPRPCPLVLFPMRPALGAFVGQSQSQSNANKQTSLLQAIRRGRKMARVCLGSRADEGHENSIQMPGGRAPLSPPSVSRATRRPAPPPARPFP